MKQEQSQRGTKRHDKGGLHRTAILDYRDSNHIGVCTIIGHVEIRDFFLLSKPEKYHSTTRQKTTISALTLPK
jgi:hypothetical protein